VRVPFSLALGLACALVSASATARGERHRWPRWPTELEQVIQPLREEATSDKDHDRVEAMLALDAYADELVEPWILHALGDPSTSVKREALRMCFERERVACVPSALAIWSSVTEPMLRVAALRVVGLDPAGAGLDALLGALRDDNDTMRAQAATVLGSAALHGSARTRAAAALLAKLGDLSSAVRQAAVESLGTIGSTDATLAVARLLEDTEPMVRLSAARALGQIGDPRGVAAVIRALESTNEPAVVRSLVAALAILPGDTAAETLLAAFDEPPTGLSAPEVADLIGLRPNPEPLVTAGLAQRLRDPTVARLALRALAMLGPVGTAVLEDELDRGASPEIALEIGRVLAGGRLATKPARSRPLDVTAAPHARVDSLARRRGAPTAEGIADIDTLARARDWGALIDATLQVGGVVGEHRVDLALVIAEGARAKLGRWNRRSIATLVGWASDDSNTSSDRCLAALALGSVDPSARGARRAREGAERLLADADPRVRACAVVGWHVLATRPDDRAMLDPDPRVRATAILVAGARGPTRTERGRIALLEAADPDAFVRVAARWTRDAKRGKGEPRTWIHGGALDPSGRWMRVRVGEQRLWLPSIRVGAVPFAWAPGLRGVTADPDD
jgi:HEAT repeat protein